MGTKIPDAGVKSWLTVPEVAEELHIPRTRCYDLIQRGELPAVRIGERSIRVNRAELERQQAAHALTIWRGFGAFCQDRLGLGATKILGVALEHSLERIEELEEMADRLGLEPDEESAQEIGEDLAEAWRMVEERGA
jgi:excisionase family DNA binding protein